MGTPINHSTHSLADPSSLFRGLKLETGPVQVVSVVVRLADPSSLFRGLKLVCPQEHRVFPVVPRGPLLVIQRTETEWCRP